MSIFYIVSKLFQFFITPAGIISILLFFAFFSKNQQKTKKVIVFTLLFFHIFSSQIIVNELLLWWEEPSKPISKVEKHDVGIILTGGITNDDKLPQENIFLHYSADRVGQALQLYKKGKIDKVLISGGSKILFGKIVKQEAIEVANFLIIAGVPKERIFLELNSFNTRENAVNSSKILKKQFPNQKYLLITSAFHLKRAKACFEKVGIKTTSFGSHYLSNERQLIFSYFLPKESSLDKSYLVFREIVGYVTYKLMGYC